MVTVKSSMALLGVKGIILIKNIHEKTSYLQFKWTFTENYWIYWKTYNSVNSSQKNKQTNKWIRNQQQKRHLGKVNVF